MLFASFDLKPIHKKIGCRKKLKPPSKVGELNHVGGERDEYTNKSDLQKLYSDCAYL